MRSHQGIRMPPSLLESKPATEWGPDDLKTLLVEMVPMRLEQFFGCRAEDLPTPKFIYPNLEEILTAGCGRFAKPGERPSDLSVVNFFNLIEGVHSASELTVDLLALEIMKYLGYQLLGSEGQVNELSTQHQLYFQMDGARTEARVDIALVDRARALLCLFVQDKRLLQSETNQATLTLKWPHAQVVAHALAACNVNTNEARGQAQLAAGIGSEDAAALAHEHVDMVIPAFTLIGSLPCFYLIPITTAFASAVASGELPPHPTKVFYCTAPVQWKFYGMMLKDQRLLILQMFEAFKHFIPTDFTQLCRFSRLSGGTIPRPLNPTFSTNVWDLVRQFLSESEEHCRRRGINKVEYASGSINHFVGSSSRSLTS